MNSSPIRLVLTETAVAAIMDAITARSSRLLAGEPDESYRLLECRWREIGGMLELARRLDAYRLVRALEAHKDALRRRMDAL